MSSRRRCRSAASAVVVAVLLCLPACQDHPTASRAPAAAGPSVSAEIVQLRRDQVLQRVEVAVHNDGSAELFVERLRLPGRRLRPAGRAAQGRAAPGRPGGQPPGPVQRRELPGRRPAADRSAPGDAAREVRRRPEVHARVRLTADDPTASCCASPPAPARSSDVLRDGGPAVRRPLAPGADAGGRRAARRAAWPGSWRAARARSPRSPAPSCTGCGRTPRRRGTPGRRSPPNGRRPGSRWSPTRRAAPATRSARSRSRTSSSSGSPTPGGEDLAVDPTVGDPHQDRRSGRSARSERPASARAQRPGEPGDVAGADPAAAADVARTEPDPALRRRGVDSRAVAAPGLRAPPSQLSPLFGYATAGLPLAATARTTSSSTCSGAVQLTPTATTRVVTAGEPEDPVDVLAAAGRRSRRSRSGSASRGCPRASRRAPQEDRRLLLGRHGLHRQQVGPGGGQHLGPRPVEVPQRGIGEAVVAGVLRAVGQHRAVRADRRGDVAVDAVARLVGRRPRPPRGPARRCAASAPAASSRLQPRDAKPAKLAW